MTESWEEQYDAHAFDGCLGQQVPLKDRLGGRVIGTATVARIDGRGVIAEFTLDESAEPSGLADMPAMSFAFCEPEAPLRDPLLPAPVRVKWRES